MSSTDYPCSGTADLHLVKPTNLIKKTKLSEIWKWQNDYLILKFYFQ